MQKLLKAVEMGLYTGVLCIELERLSRGDGADQQRILKAFQFSDTKIITLTKTYDLAGDDSFDEEFFEFGLFMSRREYKMIKKRLYRGRIQAQKEGYFIGSRPPYGYNKERIGKGYVLVPNENAEVVRYIFRRYAQRETAANILHDLNNMAIPTVTGTKWTAYAIREVIKNQTYIGKINTKTVRCEKSIKDGKVVQRWLNNYEPVVFCSVCGKTIRRTHYDYKGERTFYYGCVTSRCETKNTFTHVVYDMVMAELKKELERQQVMLADYDTSPDHDARKDELEMLKAELGKKSMMLERACEAYETGIYDRQTYLERVQKVNAARAELQARVEELEASIEESEERHAKAVPILTRVVEEMHTLEPKEQNDLLKMIVDRIEYEKTESGAAIEPTLRISLKI
jgi:DNA invertase Pin-like site-specific DNA recombinase